MRVLFITNFYPPNVMGGWEQNCKEIVERFQARGHLCHVLTSNWEVNNNHSLAKAHVSRNLYLEADPYNYSVYHYFREHDRQGQANRNTLLHTLDAFQPELIFVWGMWNLSKSVAYWSERWMPGRVAYAIASYWLIDPSIHEVYWRYPSNRAAIRLLMLPLSQLARRLLTREQSAYRLELRHVACVSEYVRKKLDSASKLPHGARVIYNGIDPQPFLEAKRKNKPESDRFALVYTGALNSHKGVHKAIEALGLLEKQGRSRNLYLDVIGRGHPGYEACLKRRVAELGLANRVKFIGHLPRTELPRQLSDKDVFLFTSTYEEPIARSVMEAMAGGLAVIASEVGGQSEMLEDRINSLTYPAGDVEKLANCILELQRDLDLRNRLAVAGRNTIIERFTLKHMVDEMENWLISIIR